MLEILSDERCLLHRAPPDYPESPARLTAIRAALEAAGYTIASGARRDDALEWVRRVHTGSYIERFQDAIAAGAPLLDAPDNPLCPRTWDASLAAIETVLQAADVAAVPQQSAFALVRPPGHHCERDHAMGFCFFNNVAVAAEYLRQRHGCRRLAVLDFDVHHGNGTQHIFERDPDVFFASCHQSPFYPGTGAVDETGKGPGEGATLNVPMTAGCGDAEYERVFDEVLIPAVAEFAPEVLLVSAGFDAWEGDPLGGMRVTEAGHRAWGEKIRALAAGCSQGRVLCTLEGGYDVPRLGNVVDAFLQGLGGRKPDGRQQGSRR